MEDRQNGPVMDRIEKLIRVPSGGKRTGLRLTITHNAGDYETGIIERRPKSMAQRVPQLAAFVDGPGRLRSHVARNAAGKRELPAQSAKPLFVLSNERVHFTVRPFQVYVRYHRRTAVARARDVYHVQVVFPDHAIQVDVHEVLTGRCAPMTEQAWLDVLGPERYFEQRVVEKIDLSHGQIVCSPPIGVHSCQGFLRKGPG